MAKNSIRDYSNVNSSNSDIQSIDISEGCSPAGINNAIREIMADTADFVSGTVGIDVLSLADNDASHALKFQAPASVTTTVTFTLPDGDGTTGQTLITDGSGVLSWGAGGGGSFLGDSGGGTADIIRVHEEQLDTDITVAANTNGLCAGPLTVATGVTVTVSGNLVIA
jgi:hypothetical protein